MLHTNSACLSSCVYTYGKDKVIFKKKGQDVAGVTRVRNVERKTD